MVRNHDSELDEARRGGPPWDWGAIARWALNQLNDDERRELFITYYCIYCGRRKSHEFERCYCTADD